MRHSIRQIIREQILPASRQIGSEGIHEVTAELTRGNVDYSPQTNTPGQTTPYNASSDIDPVQYLSDTLRNLDAGYNEDPKTIELIQRMVDTGLIEYMSDGIRHLAEQLMEAGAVNMNESADNKTNPAQRDVADIKVKGDGPEQEETGTEKIKKPEGLKSQPAHSIAKIPKTGGDTNVTSVGYQNFPVSTGAKKTNPAGIPDAEGKQKAGVNNGDSMAGKSKGMAVGNSLYQQDAEDRDKGQDYTGTKVGSVKESKGIKKKVKI